MDCVSSNMICKSCTAVDNGLATRMRPIYGIIRSRDLAVDEGACGINGAMSFAWTVVSTGPTRAGAIHAHCVGPHTHAHTRTAGTHLPHASPAPHTQPHNTQSRHSSRPGTQEQRACAQARDNKGKADCIHVISDETTQHSAVQTLVCADGLHRTAPQKK